MINLNIKDNSQDLPIIKRKKKSLLKKFSLKSENDLRDAVELAVFLYVMEEIEQCKDLLLSFLVFDYDKETAHLWWVHQEGMVLLAYIHRQQSNGEAEEKLIEIVCSDDFMPSYPGEPENQYLSKIHEHKRNMEYARSETQKYKCNAIFVELIGFIYLYEMLPCYDHRLKVTKSRVGGDIKEHLKKTIDDCCSELRHALKDATRKNQAELDRIHEELEEKYRNFPVYKEVGRSLKDKLSAGLMGSLIKMTNRHDKP